MRIVFNTHMILKTVLVLLFWPDLFYAVPQAARYYDYIYALYLVFYCVSREAIIIMYFVHLSA